MAKWSKAKHKSALPVVQNTNKGDNEATTSKNSEWDHGRGYLNTNVLNVLQAPVKITETTGLRQAKKIALKDAIWKVVAGRAASHKRPASPTGNVVKKKCKQTRKPIVTLTTNDDEDSDQENVLINLLVPPTPRKSHPIKMDSNACIVGHCNNKDDKGSAAKDPNDLFDTESSSNGTDADTSNKDSDKGNDTSDGDTELDKLSMNPKALKMYFVNEHPVWLKDNASKLHNTDFIIHSQLPKADSDNKHDDDMPTPHSPHFTTASFKPKKVKSLSCQEIINIAIAQQCMSKTSKELTVLNYSELTTYILGSKGILAYSATRPLAEKAKDSSHTPCTGTLSEKDGYEANDENDEDDCSGSRSENESVVEEGDEAMLWLASTNLVQSKSSKNLSLKAQQHQVKLAIRQTMDYLEEKILFNNTYPSLHL